jgi:ubiquinone/menaquinone biosynthesis C-methylase UbiE
VSGSGAAAFQRRLLRRYDALCADPVFQAFLGHSGYANYGWWAPGTTGGRAAADALVDRLVALLPDGPRGAVLDVACGEGGTTARLGTHFGERNVTAVNFARGQLLAARRRAPHARFACLDAAELALAAASFDVVVCVEAAFHFVTRERFLREALRVLRPGGTLLMTDVLAARPAGRVPAANLLATAREYGALLGRCGFAAARVEDVTAWTWRPFRRHYARFVLARAWTPLVLRRLPQLCWLALTRLRATERALRGYVTVCARRPPVGLRQ